MFVDIEHEIAYKTAMERYGLLDGMEGSSLLYLLTSLRTTREHLTDLIEDDDLVIKPDALHHSWQTDTSKKITRLAFNLFTMENPTADVCSRQKVWHELRMYAPAEIFSGLNYALFETAIQAIRMSF